MTSKIPQLIIIYSRDEMKQWDMAEQYRDNNSVKFIIGDVRDKERLSRSLDGVDYMNAAATKLFQQQNTILLNVKTNIGGAMNVIDAHRQKNKKGSCTQRIKQVTHHLYGATKLASDKLFVGGVRI